MKVYNYFDGNGNQYKISADLDNIIEYFPIKPYQSSSGVYDGGEYNKKRLDNEQFIQIESLIKTIFEKYQPKINDRRLGSGMIQIKAGTKTESLILDQNSKFKEEIEKKLKEMLLY